MIHEKNLASKGSANAVDYLSVAAMGEPEKSDALNHGPSFVTLVQEVVRSSALADPKRFMNVSGYSGNAIITMEKVHESLELSCGHGFRHFAEVYGEGLGQLLPCISLEDWNALIELATSIDQSGVAGTSREPLLELMLCFTTSLAILGGPDLQAAQASVTLLAKYCAQQLPIVLWDSSDRHAVCCVLLAAILSVYLFDEEASWHLAGLAMTKAIASGFHRFSTSTERPDDASVLFWCLYTLDRAFATVLDRPLSVEDGDMTISLPPATPITTPGVKAVDISALSIWIIHYSWMLSTWRRGHFDADLSIYLGELAYWCETCREVDSCHQPGGNVTRDPRSYLFMKAIESQLTCRALVQLFVQSFTTNKPRYEPHQYITELEREVPRFLTTYKDALDTHVLGPTILDVWSIFGATVVFIVARQSSASVQSAEVARNFYASGVAVMKVVSLCMELLRAIGLRYNAVLSLQDILWAFLTALETSSQTKTAEDIADFRLAISRSRVSVPRHLMQIMKQAVEQNL
jgi:hypothetical protein